MTRKTEDVPRPPRTDGQANAHEAEGCRYAAEGGKTRNRQGSAHQAERSPPDPRPLATARHPVEDTTMTNTRPPQPDLFTALFGACLTHALRGVTVRLNGYWRS